MGANRKAVNFYTNDNADSIEAETLLVLNGINFRKILVDKYQRSIHIPTVVTSDGPLNDLAGIRRFAERNAITRKRTYNGTTVEEG